MFGIVVVDITTKCNFKCSHCLRGKREQKDISLELFEKLCVEGHDADLGLISISGGEPILHSHFWEMLEMIQKHGYMFNFVTNGYLYRNYEEVLKYKEKLECIIVSIDGVTPESYAKMRGDMGYERAWETVDFYSRKGVYVKVQACLSAANQHESELIVERAVRYGAREVCFTGIITKFDDTYALTQEQKTGCWVRIADVAKRYNIFTNRCTALGTITGVDFCRAITGSCATRLSPYGEFYTCCDVYDDELSVGNLSQNTYGELCQRVSQVNGYLQSLRVKNFKDNKSEPWFNTCEFCVKYLREAIEMCNERNRVAI